MRRIVWFQLIGVFGVCIYLYSFILPKIVRYFIFVKFILFRSAATAFFCFAYAWLIYKLQNKQMLLHAFSTEQAEGGWGGGGGSRCQYMKMVYKRSRMYVWSFGISGQKCNSSEPFGGCSLAMRTSRLLNHIISFVKVSLSYRMQSAKNDEQLKFQQHNTK